MFATESQASSGTEGASFLDIPVGAGPASMGSAYSAMANDAYAATFNPGGLGFLDSTQFAGQHLSYLESIHYEYLSFGLPLAGAGACSGPATCAQSALGGSVQYLGSGDIAGTDGFGNPTGNFSSYFSAYNLSYGRTVTNRLSLGLTGKWINAKIADTSANAFAVDLGSMYQANDKLTLAAVLTNMGTQLKFSSEGDSLPLAFHVGAAYKPESQWKMSVEGVYPQTGLASAHFGVEWRPLELIAIRTGYRTDTVKELGSLAGFTTGLGLHAYGQEFSYAWVPMGDLGSAHYFSLVVRLGPAEAARRNLIQFRTIKTHRTVQNGKDEMEPEYQQLLRLLDDRDTAVAGPVKSMNRGDE